MENVIVESGPFKVKNLFQIPDLASIEWERFRDGIEIYRLHETAGGPSAALLRYAPGAALQRHVHVGHEYILVLRGAQVDDAGRHAAGTLLVYLPGTSHSVSSPEGCVVLIIWERPVSFVKTEILRETPS